MERDIKTVTMTLDNYNTLMAQVAKLHALERAGVDEWEWYGEAMDLLREQED
uniref:Uncharacterized protein n=1 Tax=Rhodopseudomonas palustris (strain DX-1) TaxID=652103 RepID=E6VL53_RHOPX